MLTVAIDRHTAEQITTKFLGDYPGAFALAYKFRDTIADLYGANTAIPHTAKGTYLSQHTPHAGRMYLGQVDIALCNIKDAEDMLETLRHEVFGHYGINTFRLEERRALLDALIAARDEPGIRDVWADINNRYAEQALYVQAEEVWALYCEKLPLLYHVDNDHARVLGEQSFAETCADRSRLMRLDDLHNIACMVAQGIRDGSREQQTFPQLGGEHSLVMAASRTLDFGNRSLDELAQEYAAMEGTDGGRVIDVDRIRELSPEYRADHSRAQDIHAAASQLSQQLYERALAQPVDEERDALVVFTAGGSGSGKSTAITRLMGDGNADITLDGTFSKLEKARERVRAALDSGRRVQIRYVYRAPENAAQTAIRRAITTGRAMPTTVLAENHVESLATVRAIAEEFRDDTRVSVVAIYNNTNSQDDAHITDLQQIPEVYHDTAKHIFEAAVDAAWRATLDENAKAAFHAGVQPSGEKNVRQAGTDTAGSGADASAGRLERATIPGSPESGGARGNRNTLTPELYRAFMGHEPPLTRDDAPRYKQRGWHASPHRFERFSLDNIGGGEGSQVHGWGLYIALNQDTAQYTYLPQFENRLYAYLFNGKRYTMEAGGMNPWRDEGGNELPEGAPLSYALHALAAGGSRYAGVDVEAATQWLEGYLKEQERQTQFAARDEIGMTEEEIQTRKRFDKAVGAGGEGLREAAEAVGEAEARSLARPEVQARTQELLRDERFQAMRDGIELLRTADVEKLAAAQLYEVEIPDDDVMLREDADLAEQPQPVKDALLNLLADDDGFREGYFDDEMLAQLRGEADGNVGVTGEELYQYLYESSPDAERASLWLHRYGIQGIRYNGMRDGECAVIFDDNAIEILQTRYRHLTDEERAAQATLRDDGQPDATTRLPTQDDLAATRHLNELMQRQHGWKAAYSPAALPDELDGLRAEVQAAFGRTVRAVVPNADEYNTFGGMYLPTRPGEVFVNVQSGFGFMQIVGHELLHDMRRTRPDLYNWFKRHAEEYLTGIAEYRERLEAIEDYRVQMERDTHGMREDYKEHYALQYAKEELLADFTGDALADPQFLGQLANSDGHRFTRLVTHVTGWLKGIGKRMFGLDSGRYVSDVEKLREHLQSALVAYVNGETIEEMLKLEDRAERTERQARALVDSEHGDPDDEEEVDEAVTRIMAARREFQETEVACGGHAAWKEAHQEGKTKLEYRQWVQVRTPRFKEWFGDWENIPVGEENGRCSIARHPRTGEPLVVYHGSRRSGFTVFDNQGHTKSIREGMHFFSSKENVAQSYSGTYSEAPLYMEDGEEYNPQYNYDNGIYPVFLNIRKPHEAWYDGANWDGVAYGMAEIYDNEADENVENPHTGGFLFDSEREAEEYAEKLGLEDYEIGTNPLVTDSTNEEAERGRTYGHDGTVLHDVVDDGGVGHLTDETSTVFVVYSSEQIKSATGNVGFFNSHSKDIRFARDLKTPGEIQLEADAQAFAQQVDKIFAKGRAERSVQMLTTTPLVLEMVAGDSKSAQAAQAGGIYISAHAFNQAFTSEEKGGHPDMNDPEIFKQLPQALADPLAIFDPARNSEDYAKHLNDGDLIFMLAVRDKNGATVVLPVSVTAKDRTGATINLVKTAYGKTGMDGEPLDRWFLKMLTKENAARYINERRFQEWLGAAGTSLPLGHTTTNDKHRLGYVRDFFPFGHTNAYGRRIYRWQDLRKLREENLVRYMFTGKRGAQSLDAAEEVTHRMDNLAVAREMEAADKDAKAVKLATGWERGADGKWRYELDDGGVRTNFTSGFASDSPEYHRMLELWRKQGAYALGAGDAPTEAENDEYRLLSEKWGWEGRMGWNLELMNGSIVPLYNVLYAPELFRAYPQLRNAQFRLSDEMDGYYGMFYPDENLIEIKQSLLKTATGIEEAHSVLLHEVQHAIQHIEGFAMGGNKSEETRAYVVHHLARSVKAKDETEYNEYLDVSRRAAVLYHVQQARRFLANPASFEKSGEWFRYKRMFEPKDKKARQARIAEAVEQWKRDAEDEFRSFDNDNGQMLLDAQRMSSDELASAIRKLRRRQEKLLSGARAYSKAEGEFSRVANMSPTEIYRALAGEVEARNVQSRLNMTAEQRRATLAEETEDVAREDQIVLQEMAEQAAAMHMEETVMNHSEQERAAREDVNAVDQFGRTQLGKAACREQFDVVRELLAAGANVNARDKSNGNSPLHLALERNHGVSNVMAARMLLAAGADVNARNVRGETPLHLAARSSNVDAATLLIAHGADVNAVINDGRTAVELSLAYTPDVMGTMAAFADAPEEQAALTAEEDKEHAVYICEQKIGRTALDFEEWRAARTGKELMRAVTSGNIETARVLIEQGANANFASETAETSMTVLMLAAKRGHTDIVRQLIENGADVNAGDKWEGVTALMYAIGNRHADIVRLLIESGADVNVVTTKNGDTALSLAEGWGDDDIVRLIKSYTQKETMNTTEESSQYAGLLASFRETERNLALTLSSEEAASRALGEAGIPGWRYVGGIDGECFVIWNEEAVRIMETRFKLSEEMRRAQMELDFDSPLPATPSSVEDQAAAEVLNQTLARQFDNPAWQNAYQATALPPVLAGLRDEFQAAFGRTIRPVLPTEEQFDCYGGVYLSEHPGEVFVNVRQPVNFLQLAGHEMLHDIKRTRPDLYDWFIQQAERYLVNVEGYQERLNRLAAANGNSTHTLQSAKEELIADFCGDSLADAQFCGQLAASDGNRFTGLVHHVTSWLQRLGDKLRGMDSARHVKDVDGLRKHLSDVLVAYAKGEKLEDMPSYRQAQAKAKAEEQTAQQAPEEARRVTRIVPTAVSYDSKAWILTITTAEGKRYQHIGAPFEWGQHEASAAAAALERGDTDTLEKYGVALNGEDLVEIFPFDGGDGWGVALNNVTLRDENGAGVTFENRAEAAARARELIAQPAQEQPLAAPRATCVETENAGRWGLTITTAGQQQYEYVGAGAGWSQEEAVAVAAALERGDADTLERYGVALNGENLVELFSYTTGSDREHWTVKYNKNILRAGEDGNFASLGSRDAAIASARELLKHGQTQYGYILPEGGLPAAEEAPRHATCVPTQSQTGQWGLTISTEGGNRYHDVGATLGWSEEEARTTAAALERGDTDTLERYGVAVAGDDVVALSKDVMGGWNITHNTQYVRAWYGGGVVDFDSHAVAVAHARKMVAMFAADDGQKRHAACMPVFFGGFDKWGLTVITPAGRCFRGICSGAYSDWSEDKAIAAGEALERGDADTLERYGVALAGDDVVEVVGSADTYWCIRHNQEYVRVFGERLELKTRDEAIARARKLMTAALSQQQSAQPADVVAQETTGQSATQDALPNGHIEDFGEKLGRARKDMAVSFTVNYSNDELSCLPLSKTWPEQEIDAIEDQRIAAICHTLRANIPATKPKRSSRRAVWVDKVAAGREIMRDLLSGKMQADELLNDLQKLLDGKKLARKIQLLEHLPREYWPYIAKAEERRYAIWHRDSGTWERGLVVDAHSNGLSYLVVSHEFDDRTGDGAYDLAKIAEQMREKLKDVVAQRDEQPQAEKREAQFDVAVLYNSHTDEVFAHKKGDALKRPLKTWPVPRGDNVRDMVDEDVFPWIREHRDELAAAWEEIKARDNVGKADVRSAENRIREGKDWRNGQDATPEMFTEAFGFRGVEFGNWVKQGKDDRERQWMLNQAYDALHDLADVLDIPTQAISLNGSLGLGFGSRGRGGRAAAHFEPDLVVINLTKTQGAGSLAHEWFHALDNYFSRMRNNEHGYITERPEAVSYVYKDELGQPYPWRQHRSDLENLWKTDPDKRHREPEYYNPENWVPVSEIAVRPEMEVAFARLVEALDNSPMAKRAKLNDKGRKEYWSKTVERAARAFENYVITKLDERGHHNDYLANVVPPEAFVRAAERYPYLKPEEMPPVKEAFDTLFATAQTRETDKGVALFSINPQTYAHFEKRIESLLNGGGHERGTVVLDRSDVLGLLGYRDVPLRLHEKHAQDGRAWHDKMTVEDWKKVPFWLDDPALVYLDVKDRGRAQGEYPDNLDAETSTWRLVAIAPETVQGDPVVMVLQPNLEQTLRGKVAEFHLLITTYEKDNGDLPSVAWLAKRGLLRYFDEERAREVLPEMRNARTSSNRAERAGVQFPGQNPMKSGHNVILTEKDLAAWRHKQILQAEDTSDADAGDGVKFSIRSGGGVLDDAASWAIREEFTQACRELGLIVDAPIMDGNRHRVPVEGARAGRLDGSYRGFLDGRPAGNICNFKTGVSRNWTTQQNRPAMTYQQRQEMNKAIAEKQEQDAREQAQRYEAVAQFIAKKFPTCPPVQDATPYMRAKGICWHDGVLGGVRTNVDGQKTIIVIHDENGKPWSTQTIHPDGAKIFFKGGKISGCFHAVGGMNALGKAPSIVIAEGYATAASLAEVLEQPTVAALNAGNLKPVAEALRRKYPDKIIVIAGDDDFRQEAKNGCNPGREKAQAAAEAVGGVAVFPKFAPGEQEREGFTDFNDLAVKSKIGVLGCRHQVLHAVSQARYAATHPDEVAQQPRQRVPEPIRMCG